MDKQIVQSVLDELPEDVKMIDIIENIYLRLKVEKILEDENDNVGITQQELKEEIADWF